MTAHPQVEATPGVDPGVEMEIVRLLTSNHSLYFVATSTGCSDELTRKVADRHGYPNTRLLTSALTRMEEARARNGGAPAKPKPQERFAAERERRKPASEMAVPKPAPAPAAPAATGKPAPVGQGQYVEALLRHAGKSERARTRNLAKRIRDMLAELERKLDDEASERKAREEADAAAAATRKEIADLEAKLAAAKAKLTGGAKPAAKPVRDFDPKVVRAWAAANDVECGPYGKVPQRVVDAWRKAVADA